MTGPVTRGKVSSSTKQPKAVLRLSDRDTRIRGMNLAVAAAREYLTQAGKPQVWPGRLARLVDANLSLMGQRIMARVRRAERSGRAAEAEQAFRDGMTEVGIAAAREYLERPV